MHWPIFTRALVALRTWGHGNAAWRLRALLPRPVRSMLHRAKKSLENAPLRVVLPPSPAGQVPVRVVIFGNYADNWLARLSDAQTWETVPGVTEVRVWPDDPARPLPPPAAGVRNVIIPLSEDNIVHCPRTMDSLIPNHRAVEVLRNKAAFAAYVEEAGLSELCPITYATREQVRYPCIVKYVNAAFAFGSRILRSDRELDAFLSTEPWGSGKFIVQQCLPAPVEYVTHCVCKGGRILWSCTFSFEKETGQEIRQGVVFKSMTAIDPPAGALVSIERLLLPLAYDGPCNIDYTLTPEGRIAVFEINPRFGGTLMLPINRGYLQQTLSCIIANATGL